MSHVTHTGVIAWSTFTLLTPTFAESDVSQLLGVRMMVGAAEAVSPNIFNILKKFITKSKERYWSLDSTKRALHHITKAL